MKIIKKLLIATTLLVISQISFAQVKIDNVMLKQFANQYLTQHAVDEHVSALAITVINQNDHSTHSAYAGYTSYNGKTPINETNLFHIGSITKSFTTTLILQLEADPALQFSIEDPITKYFPYLKKWQGVTIRQLMNMTSGIPDYSESADFAADFKSNPIRYRSPHELIHFAYQLDTHYMPGTQYNYSNTNYTLLGLLIEKLTGNTYTHELETRLFRPARLTHTHYSDNGYNNTISRKIVHSYLFKKDMNDAIPMGTDATDFTMSVYGASGAIIGNSKDIAYWANALFTPGKILSENQLKKLTQIVSTKTGQPIEQPTKDDANAFGMGITAIYIPETDETAYTYEGMTLAGRAIYLYVPARKLIIAATVNSSVDGSEENKDHLGGLILQIYKTCIAFKE